MKNSNYIIRKVGTNYTQCVQRIRLRPVTPQGRIDDLTVINFENFRRDPSLGHYRGKPTLFDESIPSLLEPLTTVVATRTVTEDPPPVTVNIRFPIAPAPVPVGLAAVVVHPIHPIPPPAVATAPTLVAPDTTDVEAPEPQVLERPYLPTQDIRFSDSSDNSSTIDAPLHARTLRDTPTYMISGEQKLPAEAVPTDRQSPLRSLSRLQSSHGISGAGSINFLNNSQRNISNAFEFERQGPQLAPQFAEAMPTDDHGTLRVSQTRFSHSVDSDSSVDSTLKIQTTSVIFVLLFNLKANRCNLLVQICLNPLISDQDYHLGIIMRKSFKTKYRVKCTAFRLVSQLLHRIS